MADTHANFNSDQLPSVISDSSQLIKVESASNGSLTFPALRGGDALWEWATPGGDHYYLYGKNPDDPNKPYLGVLNELAARHIANTLGINNQPVSMLNTVEGWKIGSLIDFNFGASLEKSDRSTLAISEEDKVINFVSHVFLADTNGNEGSVLVHSNKKEISRIDFERCFGYNGTTYNQDVLNGLGNISTGPFYNEIRGNLLLENIITAVIFQRIQSLGLNGFLEYSQGLIDAFSMRWPNSREELLQTRCHIHDCLQYRKENIRTLVADQLSKA
jgi:hypothetical protein